MKKILFLFLLPFLLITNTFSYNEKNPINIKGIWEGFLVTSDGSIRLVYRIFNSDGHKIRAFHDSPDYGIKDIPVSESTFDGDQVVFKVGLYHAVYTGKLKGDTFVGMYNSGGSIVPLVLKKICQDPNKILDYMVPRLGVNGNILLKDNYRTPKSMKDGLKVKDAKLAGFDTDKINSMINDILHEKFKNIHSVVVLKDTNLIIDEYFYGFKADKLHPLHSVSKGITATLFGIALDQNILKSLDKPLLHYFQDYENYLNKDGKESIQLHHLLSMTAGFKWDEQSYSYYDSRNSLVSMKRNKDWLAYLFSKPLINIPGEHFVYNTGLVYALEEIIRRTSKLPAYVYAHVNLFKPLNISNYKYDDIVGYHLSPRDMTKIGSLFINNGAYKDEQIVPEQWVDKSLDRLERCSPRYWNHWYPKLYLYNDIPIAAFQAGGFGGQSITIFSTLQMTIVITAGNFIESTNYDDIISKYILPSSLSNKSIANNPEIAYTQMKKLDHINLENRWDSEIACLKSSVDYLDLDISDPWLYGMTGLGFLINIDEKVFAKSTHVWNKEQFYKLCQNIGFQVESIWSHKSNPEFRQHQKETWDLVRKSIDNNLPCYGFHLENPVRYMITGYDNCGYYYKGRDNREGLNRVYWVELGNTNIGLLGMHIVKPVELNLPVNDMLKQAFQFVVEHFNNSKKWINSDCKAGAKGFDRWISALSNGTIDPEGAVHLAATIGEYRYYAVEFLRDMRTRFDPELRSFFDEALDLYQISSESINKVAELFPANSGFDQWVKYINDKSRCAKAIEHLENAKNAEMEGILILEKIIEIL